MTASLQDFVPIVDWLTSEYQADPYAVLARFRRHDPVHRDPSGIWVVTRHDDVSSLLRDKSLGRDYRRWHDYARVRPFLPDTALERLAEHWPIFRDPPDHTRLRQFTLDGFTPIAASLMPAWIEPAADTLLESLDGRDEFDLMTAFARPLAIQTILRLLGLPARDYERVRNWSDAIAQIFEPVRSAATKQAAAEAVTELQQHFRSAIDGDGADLSPGLIAWIRELDDCGTTVSGDERLATLVLLAVAGHETTSNAIGNGLLALLRAPAECARLRTDPSLAVVAGEELLRFEPSTPITSRIAHRDIVVRNRTIREGEVVFCMLNAANRDPAVFDDPDVLNVTRQPNPHLTFGAGAHYCLGAALARCEIQAALPRILRRWRRIEVAADGVEWLDMLHLRGLRRLTLRVDY